jgi:beta-fructofuranosidase
LIKETAENRFEFYPPLFHPMRYDDIEVPNLIKLNDRYYLIGSIREDIKVHYWYADTLEGPYQNFSDNVLLPQGNYAARVSQCGDRYLIWNFFYKGLTTQGQHLLAPPKELVVDDNGKLHLKSFAGFDELVSETLTPSELKSFQPLFGNPNATGKTDTVTCWLSCNSGFEAFLLPGEYGDFMLSGKIELEGQGKCGLVLCVNDEGDGYYLSLELAKGIAQIRAWGHNADGGIEKAFRYEQLQTANYVAVAPPLRFRLVKYQQYLEFSLDGYVMLTLADDHFERGRVGFYIESAKMRVDNLKLELCEGPTGESYPTSMPNY